MFKRLSFVTLIIMLPLIGADNSESFLEIFNKLADRIYCIAELNGNEHKDIEKELDLVADKIETMFKDQKINPSHHKKEFLAACGWGNKKIVNQFLDAQFNIEESNESWQTPLMIAALTGNIDVVELLLERNANINAVDKKGGDAKYFAQFIPTHMSHGGLESLGCLPVAISAAARYGSRFDYPFDYPFQRCKEMIEAKEKQNQQ